MARNKLTAKQERFVAEYLVDLNATQAAIRAGYSAKTAAEIGAENLRKPQIAAAVQKAQQARSVRTGITQDRVLNEIAIIAFQDARKMMTWGPRGVTFLDSDELPDDVARCVVEASQTVTPAGGTIRVKMADKLSALKLVGEHLGMFAAKAAGETDDIAAGLLRAAIRESVERRAAARRSAEKPGETGGGGPAPGVEDAGTHRTD